MDKSKSSLAATRTSYDRMTSKSKTFFAQSARAAIKSYAPIEYKRDVIEPGAARIEVQKTKSMQYGEKEVKAVEKNVNILAKSLENLQGDIIRELEKSSSGWKIVRDSSKQAVKEYFKVATGGDVGNIKQAGKQWSIQIADVMHFSSASWSIGSAFWSLDK